MIDANLDDLQSGVEACARAVDQVNKDAAAVDQMLSQAKTPGPVASLVRHTKGMRACADHQRVALQELRDALGQLREELNLSQRAVRPSPGPAALTPREAASEGQTPRDRAGRRRGT